MKRQELLRHLSVHGAKVIREGRRHTIMGKGRLRSEIPRHNEIVDQLAMKICKDLDLPFTR
jgi:mRNA interferase HicA